MPYWPKLGHTNGRLFLESKPMGSGYQDWFRPATGWLPGTRDLELRTQNHCHLAVVRFGELCPGENLQDTCHLLSQTKWLTSLTALPLKAFGQLSRSQVSLDPGIYLAPCFLPILKLLRHESPEFQPSHEAMTRGQVSLMLPFASKYRLL